MIELSVAIITSFKILPLAYVYANIELYSRELRPTGRQQVPLIRNAGFSA